MGASTSFFDDPIEDESISLNDNELNNILEDSGTDAAAGKSAPGSEFLNDEADVIVIDRKEMLSRIPALEKGAQVDVETVELPAEFASQPDTVEEFEITRGQDDNQGPQQSEEILLNDSTLDNIGAEPVQAPAESEEISLDDAGLGGLESSDEIVLEDLALPSSDTVQEVVSGETVPAGKEEDDVSLSLDELDNITSMDAAREEEVSVLSADESATAGETSLVDIPAESETIGFSELPVIEEQEITGLSDTLQTPALDSIEEISLEEESLLPESVLVDETLPETASAGGVEEIFDEEKEFIKDDTLEVQGPVEPVDFEPATEAESVPAASSADDFNVEEINLTGNMSESGNDTDNSVMSASFFSDEEEDESITLSTNELDNIINTSDVEEGSQGEKQQSVAGSVPDSAITVSQDNLKELFVYLDNLLDKLPEDEIRKFSESRYYDMYNRMFEELNLV